MKVKKILYLLTGIILWWSSIVLCESFYLWNILSSNWFKELSFYKWFFIIEWYEYKIITSEYSPIQEILRWWFATNFKTIQLDEWFSVKSLSWNQALYVSVDKNNVEQFITNLDSFKWRLFIYVINSGKPHINWVKYIDKLMNIYENSNEWQKEILDSVYEMLFWTKKILSKHEYRINEKTTIFEINALKNLVMSRFHNNKTKLIVVYLGN